MAGKSFSGSGKSPSVTWDGKDATGKLVEPGSYSATLTAQTEDGKCRDSKSINFDVVPPSDGQCGLYVQFGSTANMAGGDLSHRQELFSTKGTTFASAINLFYNSSDPHNASLGMGWSHSYDITLKQSNNGSMVFRDGTGKRKLYTLSNGQYVSQPGDYAALVRNSDGTSTLTQKDGTKYNFASSGSINSIVDRNGNAVTFAYINGILSSVTDPAGGRAQFTYAANHLTSITDPIGNIYVFTYSGNMLDSVSYPDGGTWRYTYDANAFMLTKTDPLGNTTTYTYDGNYRAATATDPEGKVRSVTYPQPGIDPIKTTTFTEKDGGVWTYRYDTQAGTLTSKTDPQGGVTFYTYDANGNRLSTILPDGTTTSSTYDGQGNMTSKTDTMGQTTSYAYNSFGQILSITDSQGNATRYTYDAAGNLTSVSDPVGAVSTYTYDGKGNLASMVNPLGQATSFVYDAGGNLISVTDPTGATTSYTYDSAGNMLSQTDASGAVTRYEYNAKSQLVKVTDPQRNATTYTYDLSGNKTSQTDANGNTTKYEYNYKGQLINTTDALGNSTTYAYSGTGCSSCGGGIDKLTALTDANGNSTGYQYDPLGKLVNETDPLGNATSYTYDAKGNLTSKTDGNGNPIRYTYDGNGRLLKKNYTDGSDETYTYDARGNILTATNKDMGYAFTYDATGRVTQITDKTGKAISYAYDAAGNKTKTVSPDGRTITYSYDKGRLTNIQDGGNFTFGYDSLGRRSSLTYPNGDATTYVYDKDGNLTSQMHRDSKGTAIASNSYTLDKIGNRLSNTTQDRSISYTYDAIYRLTQALSTTPGYSSSTGKGGGIPNAVQQQKEFYVYDPVGNRLTSHNTKTYVYNKGNQLVTNGGTYSYDRNGNLVSKITVEGTANYAWDYENRLIKVATPTTTAEYTYDPFGRRISKTVTDSGTTTTTHYVFDADNVLFEYDDTGAIGNRYTHGPGIDEHLMVHTGKDNYYYHADGLGSVVALTDTAGKVVQTYEYDSFGHFKDLKNRVKQPFGFTGREWDRETGLYHNGYRYYDPMEGRFISKDPIVIIGNTYNNSSIIEEKQRIRSTLDPYGYTGNNPINFTDPLGLWRTHPRYGNWGGEGWSGGNSGMEGPIDSMDMCFQQHDSCYDSLSGGTCNTKKSCDKALVECLYRLPPNSSNWQYPPFDPIYAGFYRTWALTYFQTKF
ncbi:RHS repeat-associated core domain-containing protein [Geotalea sp. SG265]|uniref:RHS repeat-associated core domain-containing protein n=1 Tax=Geotalea sp. SG265 TaxID=2922867 RepID=UPI001FAE8B30